MFVWNICLNYNTTKIVSILAISSPMLSLICWFTIVFYCSVQFHHLCVCIAFRVLGLCLLQNEICPLYLCRPVIKYILGRPIRWHDLAFYDPALYESLRGLLADTELKDAAQILSALDLTFTIDDEVGMISSSCWTRWPFSVHAAIIMTRGVVIL